MDLHQFFAASSPGSRGASAPKLGPLQKFTFFPFSLLFFHLHLKREGGKKKKKRKAAQCIQSGLVPAVVDSHSAVAAERQSLSL